MRCRYGLKWYQRVLMFLLDSFGFDYVHNGIYYVNHINIYNYKRYIGKRIVVLGEVNLSYCSLKKIPFEMLYVSGSLHINNNQISSLKGCPSHIGGDFHCRYNILKNFEYCPVVKHNRSILADHNQIKSLKGLPKYTKSLDISHNNLKTLEGCPEEMEYLKVNDNKIKTLKYCPKFVKCFVFGSASNKRLRLECEIVDRRYQMLNAFRSQSLEK